MKHTRPDMLQRQKEKCSFPVVYKKSSNQRNNLQTFIAYTILQFHERAYAWFKEWCMNMNI